MKIARSPTVGHDFINRYHYIINKVEQNWHKQYI